MKTVPINEPCLVYWINKEIVIKPYGENFTGPPELDGELLVDLSKTPAVHRYGTYHFSGTDWKHVPLEAFPSDFRMTLLLIGIE